MSPSLRGSGLKSNMLISSIIQHKSPSLRGSGLKCARRMQILLARNKFLTHPLERQVFEQFQQFINNQ